MFALGPQIARSATASTVALLQELCTRISRVGGQVMIHMQYMCLHLDLFSFCCSINGMLFLTVDFHAPAQKKLCQHEHATHGYR